MGGDWRAALLAVLPLAPRKGCGLDTWPLPARSRPGTRIEKHGAPPPHSQSAARKRAVAAVAEPHHSSPIHVEQSPPATLGDRAPYKACGRAGPAQLQRLWMHGGSTEAAGRSPPPLRPLSARWN
eukprot:CAMPEP_0174745530 /NCGR_PEP_ID=MMETSP1094-20130205/86992_1 /TAXON_ID=156173 /ORGANISM="Chrysochromulina brevifilum, Strain UTEX LB 985" /LENGTH=124 /DNA_ID=CAMNT_0015950095 /DNA_START=161 /DNA_END=533 /DNA_ORIENTATION=-